MSGLECVPSTDLPYLTVLSLSICSGNKYLFVFDNKKQLLNLQGPVQNENTELLKKI